MGRNPIRIPQEDWRERLFWTSLAVALITLLLLGLVGLAQWSERAPLAGLHAMPGSTGLMADLLIPPPPLPFTAPLPLLPAVGAGAAPRAGPRRECAANAERHREHPAALFPVNGDLCGVVP